MDEQVAYYTNKLKYEIDSWDLHEALLPAGQDEKIVVIDVRSEQAYARGHIPSAINFPHRMISEESVRELDRSVLYVVYCDGIGCNASTKGALALAKLGFRVRELQGGLDWWRRDGYEIRQSA